jgi:hypothetical protein
LPLLHHPPAEVIRERRACAEVAGIDVRSFANERECLGAILSRYMPRLDILAAVADLKKGAPSSRNFASQKSDADVELPEARFAA